MAAVVVVEAPAYVVVGSERGKHEGEFPVAAAVASCVWAVVVVVEADRLLSSGGGIVLSEQHGHEGGWVAGPQ